MEWIALRPYTHTATDWVDDPYFSDGHHLTPDGAAVFMHRFANEVLRPIVASRNPDCSEANKKKERLFFRVLSQPATRPQRADQFQAGDQAIRDTSSGSPDP